MKRYKHFIDEGMRADEAVQQSGLGYEASDVHAYLEARAKGRSARRPKAVRWRG